MHLSLMYHYVGIRPELPFFKSISSNEFERQVIYLKKMGYYFATLDEYRYVKEDIGNICILSFDDGLKDHSLAGDILSSHSCVGSFFIPTDPFEKHHVLDTHKAHLLVGLRGGECLRMLLELAGEVVIDKSESSFLLAYVHDDHESSIKEFKRIVNYYSPFGTISKYLDEMLSITGLTEEASCLYLDSDEVSKLIGKGHEIGSHGCSHRLLSRLSKSDQLIELHNSKLYLQSTFGIKVESFCYPFGTRLSYNDDTLECLREAGYKSALSVEPREISRFDSLYEVPRYDCNRFRSIFPDWET